MAAEQLTEYRDQLRIEELRPCRPTRDHIIIELFEHRPKSAHEGASRLRARRALLPELPRHEDELGISEDEIRISVPSPAHELGGGDGRGG
jgi:hypothetical protein